MKLKDEDEDLVNGGQDRGKDHGIFGCKNGGKDVRLGLVDGWTGQTNYNYFRVLFAAENNSQNTM